MKIYLNNAWIRKNRGDEKRMQILEIDKYMECLYGNLME